VICNLEVAGEFEFERRQLKGQEAGTPVVLRCESAETRGEIVSLTVFWFSDSLKQSSAELGAMAYIRLRHRAIALVATALIAGVPLSTQAPTATDVRSELSKLQDVELRLVRFRINPKEVPLPSTVTITLTFRKGNQISGRSAVNRYGGIFTATANGEIAIQLTATTQMAGPPELMTLEREYFRALSRAKHVVIESHRIMLEDEKTSMEFEFRRAR
jgi:heat shock protein HslJ